MKISVKVKPSAKVEAIEQVSGGGFMVSVKAKPTDGKANDAVVKLLAKHFDVTQSQVRLVRGSNSKQKVVEIIQ